MPDSQPGAQPKGKVVVVPVLVLVLVAAGCSPCCGLGSANKNGTATVANKCQSVWTPGSNEQWKSGAILRRYISGDPVAVLPLFRSPH